MSELKEILRIVKQLEKRVKRIEDIVTKKHQVFSPKIESKKSSKSSKKSVAGIISGMIDEGFFDTPKAFGEIVEELKRGGHYYERTSLSSPLLILLKKKVLGRISVSGNWAYVKR